MARTQYYVDPGATVDTGSGTTVGSPWGPRSVGSKPAIQHALDTITHDTTNGDQINVKAGTADTLAAALDLTTFGAPTEPGLVIRGYTSAADDGGIGEISGAATYSIFNTTSWDYVSFVDMKIGNCGAAPIIVCDNYWSFHNVEFHGTTGYGLDSNAGAGTVVKGCYFHDIDTTIVVRGGEEVSYSYFKNDTAGDADICIQSVVRVLNNILSIDGASSGIVNGIVYALIEGNTVFSNAGTGTGIASGSGNGNGKEHATIMNNLVEGFSGTGGIGIETRSTDVLYEYGYNAVNDCTTNYSESATVRKDHGENDDLNVTTLFAKSGSDTLANRFVYFRPLDEGNVLGAAAAGAYPIGSYADKGAVQFIASGGGGGGGGRQGLHSIESGNV